MFLINTALSEGVGLFSNPNWRMHAAVSTTVAYASVAKLTNNALTVGAVAFVIAILLGWIGANSIVRPIKSMTVAMKRLADGDADDANTKNQSQR